MSAEWRQYTINQISRVITGKTPPGTDECYFGGSTLFVTPTDMDEQKRITSTNRTLSLEGEKVQKRYLFKKGIVVSCIGWQMGKSAIVNQLATTNQQINTVIPDEEIIDFNFLYYVLKSKRQEIFNLGATATRTPILKKSLFEKITFNAPSLQIQRAISKILSDLDSKVELNLRINQTLEQMAQAIFKSWFVDFEPAKAKIAALEAGGSEEDALLAAMQAISGKSSEQLIRLQAEQPEQYAQLRTTAELFPSAMQDSELGEIPEGWGCGTLNDIATFSNARISTDELMLETYVSTENMLENRKGICEASSMPSSASVPGFEPGQILISNIRPYFKKIWLASMSGGRSPDVLGFKSKHQSTNEFLYNVLYQDQFFEYMMLTSKGAKMPRGDKKAIMQFALALPPVQLMQLFSARVKSFYSLISTNNHESRTLASTRDTLLPKLLSGELSVLDAESRVSEVDVSACTEDSLL